MKSDFSTRARQFFGIFFPIFYSLLILLLVQSYYDYQQNIRVAAKKKLWSEKATLLLASIKENNKFSHLIRNSGNNLANDLENQEPGDLDAKMFLSCFNRCFSPQIADRLVYRWAFLRNKNRSKSLSLPGFTNTRKRVMEKVFSALVNFSRNEKIAESRFAQDSKFIKGVLGKWSAPLTLGRFREGDLTPVKFEGKNFYFYWRQFKSSASTFGGIIFLVPEAVVEDDIFAKQQIAEKVFKSSQSRMALAFLPAEQFKKQKKIILPSSFSADKAEHKRIHDLLSQVKQLSSASRSEMQILSDHVFIRSVFSIDNIYDAVIFAPVPAGFTPKRFQLGPPLLATILALLLLFGFFYKKEGRAGLPLPVSFRLLFFLTGIIPVLVMLIAGSRLIDETFQAEILELKQKSIDRLSMINERSDMIKPMFSWHIAEMLQQPELQKSFKDSDLTELRPLFDQICHKLAEKEMALGYMFAFAPGQAAQIYLKDHRRNEEARLFADLMATSVFEANKSLSLLSSQPTIRLSSSQKNWHEALKGLGRDFLKSIFFDSYETENTMNFGNSENNLFYSVILSRGSKILKYLVFSADSEGMFRSFLKRELDSINVSSANVFLAAERLQNSDFSLFPFKKMNVLNSTVGKKAFNFIRKCRGSMFQQTLTDKDSIYVYYPLTRMKKYSTGSVVSLAQAHYNREMKFISLFVLALLMAAAMYILASFASEHIINPLGQINQTLEKIIAGKLDTRLSTERKDEIGLLINTINLMQKGFEKRKKLGKFVSGTLEKSLENLSDASQLEKPGKITGTVIFSDIRNFTSLSEKYAPSEVAEMLNYHLDNMSDIAQAFGGQIEQFIGDAIVVVFKDTNQFADSLENAVKAAMSMRQKHNQIQEQRNEAAKFVYEIGFGIEHGSLVAGMLSSKSRSEFIITGEPRSKAEELEASSKKGKFSRIIVSKTSLEFLPQDTCCEKLSNEDVYEIKS
ncbi:MAG: adenylate cyclase [Clostridiales bacterium]|nr:adenylate cyclase [Clostridiales bacterium]MDN5283434.1 adenylate cyclase [Candidatus Ozemobacter sp.]